jgi:phage-related protein
LTRLRSFNRGSFHTAQIPSFWPVGVYLCFFFRDGKIIVTNAFTKKTQELPQGEKDLALKAFRSYEKRIKEVTYYEKET